MPTQTPIPFWTTSNEAKSSSVSAEKLVNWYLEKSKLNAKYPYALYPTPGLKLLAAIGNGPCRGMAKINDLLYLVSGTKLYQVSSDYSYTELGNISGYGDVKTAVSDTQILIATNNQFYCISGDTIIELPHTSINGVAYQDGYGIASQANTNTFWISALDDMTSWSLSDFSTADAQGDNLISMASVQRMLWFFKERTIEFWTNTGAAAFPFERIQGGFMELGCLSAGSIAVAGNQMFWLGNDYQVYMAVGFEPRRISTSAISDTITRQTSPRTCNAFVYSQSGHTFYGLSFSGLTLVYDTTEDSWHYRKTQTLDRWRANNYLNIWNMHIVGDYDNGNLYELDQDTYTDNSVEIRREATSAPIAAAGNLLSMPELHIDMEMGNGLDGSVQGSDPVLLLSFSDNGGRTFGNELEASMGKIGEYTKQIRFNRLGSFRQRSIRIAVSDPVKAIVTGAFARVEPCDV